MIPRSLIRTGELEYGDRDRAIYVVQSAIAAQLWSSFIHQVKLADEWLPERLKHGPERWAVVCGTCVWFDAPV